MTVTIVAAGYGSLGAVTETLPDGFAYVSQTGADAVLETDQEVRFTLLGADKTFSYVVTASSTAGSYSFSGMLRDDDTNNHPVTGASAVTVSAATTTPDPTPVAPVATEEPEESDPPSLADSSIIAAVNGDAAISGPLAMIIVKDQGSAAAVPPVTAQPNATITGCWIYQSGNHERTHVHP